MIEQLAPLVSQGNPIIGLEPSCLLTFRDEYLKFFPDEAQAQQLADNAVLIEEFIAANAERFKPLFESTKERAGARRIIFHAHCYQKALTDTKALKIMLALPGWVVQEIDSGCCGLAGSFGYEAEHYTLSMQIGADRLFPAIRAAEGVPIAASGMSCRHQIAHGTGRAARHPIEWLADNVEHG